MIIFIIIYLYINLLDLMHFLAVIDKFECDYKDFNGLDVSVQQVAAIRSDTANKITMVRPRTRPIEKVAVIHKGPLTRHNNECK